eukprot:GDKK01015446.1.p1 GENE.GDKK01015446.1~~GDKK01015446.1.p1  ORF type:complete len:300 (-),score=52.62 GDKK01015446.1:21-872(-)
MDDNEIERAENMKFLDGYGTKSGCITRNSYPVADLNCARSPPQSHEEMDLQERKEMLHKKISRRKSLRAIINSPGICRAALAVASPLDASQCSFPCDNQSIEETSFKYGSGRILQNDIHLLDKPCAFNGVMEEEKEVVIDKPLHVLSGECGGGDEKATMNHLKEDFEGRENDADEGEAAADEHDEDFYLKADQGRQSLALSRVSGAVSEWTPIKPRHSRFADPQDRISQFDFSDWDQKSSTTHGGDGGGILKKRDSSNWAQPPALKIDPSKRRSVTFPQIDFL